MGSRDVCAAYAITAKKFGCNYARLMACKASRKAEKETKTQKKKKKKKKKKQTKKMKKTSTAGGGGSELWREDAGRASGGVDDLGHDRGHCDVGETRDADVADDYDDHDVDDDEEEDKDYEDKDYEEEEEEDDKEKDKEEEEEEEDNDKEEEEEEDDDDKEEEEEEEEEQDDDEDDKEEEEDNDDLDPRGRGPTEEAVAAARDEASSFMAYFPPEIEDSVIAMTNLEADRHRPAIDGWKPMGRVEFRAYVGLLVLAGVYRSRGEACESLWDAESGRSVFRATMPLKTFRAYSSALRFDDRETRRAGRGKGGGGGVSDSYDKLAPHQSRVGRVVREVARHVPPGTGGHRR